MAQMSRKQMTEVIWLQYFNDYLYEQGIINASDRNKIRSRINVEKQDQTL